VAAVLEREQVPCLWFDCWHIALKSIADRCTSRGSLQHGHKGPSKASPSLEGARCCWPPGPSPLGRTAATDGWGPCADGWAALGGGWGSAGFPFPAFLPSPGGPLLAPSSVTAPTALAFMKSLLKPNSPARPFRVWLAKP
jgi:hypothetical protein